MILGLDVSSKTIHGVFLDNKGAVKKTFKCESKAQDMDARLKELGNQFEEIALSKVKLAIIENGVYIQNIKATNGIVQVIGMVKYLCSKHCPVLGIDNRSWKKEILADGNSGKEKIAEFAKARWGDSLPNEQDFFDAACISLAGLKRMNQSVSG